MTEDFVSFFYAAWFALSVLRQLPGAIGRLVRRADVLRIVPEWSFFVFPTRYDYTLARRYRLADGRLTDWESVTVTGPRRGVAWMWHPDFLPQKIASDFAKQMVATANTVSGEALTRARPYTRLVALLSATAPCASGIALQFMVRSSRQYDPDCPNRIVFLSQFHKVVDA